MSPRRGDTRAFGATVYATVPFPCPLADDAIASQSTSLRAVQEHSRLTVTCRVPLPPPASATGALAASVGTQCADDGPVTFMDDDEQLPQNSSRALHRTSRLQRTSQLHRT